MERQSTTVAGSFIRIAGMALLLAGCATLEVHTAQNPSASFAAYRTYAHSTAEAAPGGFARTALTPAVLAKVEVHIDRELAKKGYALAPAGAQPDLLVHSAAGRRTYAHELGGKPSEEASWLDTSAASHHSEATLVIDVYDARTRALVWHGASHRELDPTPVVRDASLAESVAAILDTFPAGAVAAEPPRPGPFNRERLVQ